MIVRFWSGAPVAWPRVGQRGSILGRPTKTMITRDSATRAALEVIDHQGLDGFSLDLVARRLGGR